MSETEAELKAQLDAMRASTSWRITAPLRLLARAMRGEWSQRLRARRLLDALLGRLARSALLRRSVNALLSPFPGLRARVRNAALPHIVAATARPPLLHRAAAPGSAQAQLPRSARRVLADLRAAMRRAA